jgi:hypothetical protein
MTTGDLVYGSPEHATEVTAGRHPGIRDGLQWLTYAHLPEALQRFSKVFYQAAIDLLERIGTDSPELTTAINKLIEAKDSAVRAGIRHDTGRAGSVPRPQTVTDPPTLSDDAAEILAEKFHETYERLAPEFGYRTREESAKPWAEVPERNKKLMVAVAAELLSRVSVTANVVS